MRIISGSLKGRQLKFPKNIRPTTNKVRKAIFDSLGDFTKGASILELFAGSGAVGIEAFSYGASRVVFVDKEVGCLRLLESNLKSIDIADYKIYKQDSLECVDYLAKKGLSFDIIFLDPPYRKGLAKKSLLRISACDILPPYGILIIEHHKKEELPEDEGSLILFKQRRYGDAVLSFYKKREAEMKIIG